MQIPVELSKHKSLCMLFMQQSYNKISLRMIYILYKDVAYLASSIQQLYIPSVLICPLYLLRANKSFL